MLDASLEFIVDDTGDRLDRWLAQQDSRLSRAQLQKLIEQGKVTRNGQICRRKQTRLDPGDRLKVSIPPAEPIGLLPEAIPLDILYEDDQLIIINKPAGLVVHPAPGHPSGTLVNALLHHCSQLSGIGGIERPGIVHRLDKDTTGAIMVAKTQIAHRHLQAQLQTKTAGRIYLGIVRGCPTQSHGTIDLAVGRHPVNRQKMAVLLPERGGRSAITHWQLKEKLGNYALVQFQLETGRTHQIRVHSTALGYPLLGDRCYGSPHDVGVNLPGQALHAWQLRLLHPTQNIPLCTEAPLPKTFSTLLNVLRRRAGHSNHPKKDARL